MARADFQPSIGMESRAGAGAAAVPFDRIVELVSDGVFALDPQQPGSPVVYANRSFERLTGLAATTVAGRPLPFLEKTGPQASDRSRAARAVARGEAGEFVLEARREDDSVFRARLALHPLRDGQHGLTHVVGTLTDLADGDRVRELEETKSTLEDLLAARSVHLEKALGRVDARRRLSESILQGIGACVVTTDASGRVTFANRMAGDLLGADPESLSGRHVLEVFPETAPLRDALAGLPPGGERRLEFAVPTRAGAVELGMTVKGAPSEQQPELGAVLVFRDLADRRQYEMELRRLHGLTALGQMAAGFAHEVRNPLAAMRSMVELLATELPADSSCHEMTARLLVIVTRLEKLVRRSLRFGQPSPPIRKACSPAQLAAEAVAVVHPRFARLGEGATVSVEAREEVPAVFVDEDQVIEALVVLLENAIEATSDPRRVRVSIGPGEKDGFVRLGVIDDGPGIPPADVSRIFDPFYTTKPRGTGLGLAIADRLVKENGGHLHLSSRPGSTEFRILLPEVER